MLLWISCILIGYITCHPIQQETAAPRFMHWPPPSSYRYWERRARSDPGSSSYLPVVPVLRSNNAPELPALLEASSSAGPGNYRAPAYAGNGYNGNIQVVDYGSSARLGLSSEPAGEEEPEPVFSEVAGPALLEASSSAGPGNYRAPNFYRSPNMAVVKDDNASLRDERYNSLVVREPEVAYAASRYDTSAPEDNVGSYYNFKDASWMDGHYNNPQVSEPEVAYAGNGYNSNIQVVDYGSSARPGLSSEPAGEEEPKPVFSEVAGPALLEASSSAGPGNYRAPAYAGNGYNSNIQVVDYGSSARPGLSSEPAGEEEPKPVFSEVAGPALLEASSSAGPGNYRAPAYAGNGYNSNIQVVDYGSSARPGLSSEPAGEEEPEPVFSEVAGLEPVSSFSSRSRYQRKRSQVAQTRYIPGEPVPWHAPSKYVF
ncbi:uncharacterized protein LOC117543678 isoform X2 [Gymnodraco acuticeps]|uniref:Uncharacterized protein LOC117543678 isoform X2 n=1 Tax=Gymnodraco acuticeps TaxID=8218 RepID=A0A6P8TUL5_GYMAC|nr:uncharacterized protein LOC117543678 isoform X2 [Gymnodraco acuticeps]